MRSWSKRASWPGALLTIVLSLARPMVAGGEGPSPVLAELDGKRILAVDLQARLVAERRRDAAQGRLDSFTSAAKQKTLDTMIDTKRLAIAARAEGLDQRPEVRREVENLLDELLAQAMVDHLKRRIAVTDEARRQYHARHPEQFQVPGRVKARHVLVATQSEAVSLQGRLRRNADFAAVAREHNIDSTRATGGDLGWIQRGVMVEAFDKVLFALKVGEISPTVRTSHGFHVIQVQEIEPPKAKPFASVAAEIDRKIVDGEIAAFKAQLATKHPFKVHAEVLKSVR